MVLTHIVTSLLVHTYVHALNCNSICYYFHTFKKFLPFRHIVKIIMPSLHNWSFHHIYSMKQHNGASCYGHTWLPVMFTFKVCCIIWYSNFLKHLLIEIHTTPIPMKNINLFTIYIYKMYKIIYLLFFLVFFVPIKVMISCNYR